jgi:hypothetical protein
MYLEASDLIQARVPFAMPMRGLGELKAGVDYYHPPALRVRYAFTKAADKAPIPTDPPPAGSWWVLTRLPTGVYYYNLEDKPGAPPPASPADAVTTAVAKPVADAITKAIVQPTVPAPAPEPEKSNLPLYIGLGVGGVVILGAVAFFATRR